MGLASLVGFASQRSALFGLLAILIPLVLVGRSAQAVPVRRAVGVDLVASWDATPLHLEASEFFASESPARFWAVVDHLHAGHLDNATEEGLHARITEFAASTLSPTSQRMLNYALLMRYYSPKVEMFRQYARLQADQCASDAWVHIGTHILCTPAELKQHLEQSLSDVGAADEATLIFGELEHLYPNGATATAPLAVLYGQLGTPSFAAFHQLLSAAANASTIRYTVRHYTPTEPVKRAMNLQGYGVELAIKSTEYKVIDDNVPKEQQEANQHLQGTQDEDTEIEGFFFSKLKQRKPDLAQELDAFKEHLQMVSQQNENLQQLRAWQIKDLGFQASQRIVSSSEPLKLLRDISHNFPSIANSLARLRIDPDVRSQIEANQDKMSNYHLTGDVIHLHGRLIRASSLTPFALFELLQKEIAQIEALNKFGLSRLDVDKLLSLVPNKPTIRLDMRDRKTQAESADSDPNNVNGVIQFANDLEKDEMYQHWPELRSLLQPVFPGQLRYVRRNVQTIIVVLDPTTLKGIQLLVSFINFVEQGLPFRVGFVFSVDGDNHNDAWRHSPDLLTKLAEGDFESIKTEGVTNTADQPTLPATDAIALLKTYLYAKAKTDTLTALKLFAQLYKHSQAEIDLSKSKLWDACASVLKRKAQRDEWEEAIKSDKYEPQIRALQSYIDNKGVKLNDKNEQYVFVNGKFYHFGAHSSINQMIQNLIMQETWYGYSAFQEGVYRGELNGVADLWSWILDRSKPLFTRFSPSLFLSSGGDDEPGSKRDDTWISLADHKELLSPHTAYLSHPSSEFEIKEFTHLVVGDLSTQSGLTQALEAVLRLTEEQQEKVRVGFLHNTIEQVNDDRENKFIVARALHTALTSGKTLKRVFPFVVRLLATALAVGPESMTLKHVEELAEAVQLKDLSSLMSKNVDQAYSLFNRDRHLAQSLLGLGPGERAMLTNGKLMTLAENGVMRRLDMRQFETFEGMVRVSPIKTVLEGASGHEGVDPDDLTSEFYSNEVAAVVSVLSSTPAEDKNSFPSLAPSFIAGEKDNPSLVVTAIINPLSKSAQKTAPLLISLAEKLNVQVRVVLNPQRDLSELPLKSFYRYVLQEELLFDSEGRLLREGVALFNNLPTSLLLSLSMDTPHTWLVQAIRSVYDLDNIMLKDMGDDSFLSATYELEHILFEGQCADESNNGMPAVGLQINLGTQRKPHVTDTTVMANLGYFQLKANPGLWQITLGKRFGDEDQKNARPYQLLDEARQPVPHHPVKISSFSESFVLFRVKRSSANTTTTIEKNGDDSIWGQVMGFFDNNNKETAVETKDDTIHIFSVASGHLYERFLKIMMLTVLKNTKSPVKFWFLENYLSPKFKEFAPLFSKAYNTSIELVTYQWPGWLHHEQEKQRVIWGYKILFLDVLFPMDLRKVIFVDADQIVRTDLKELYDMDLHGAPLAYTPFCDSRKEMDGFRFWKQGFWKSHLKDLPYHISALYVIDLKRFREMGAGDIIRATYQQLSQDQNSLANLDQDLPNFLQERVPIYSLPQEWLWCETWCDDESKARAKTIDLCNNPLTKTPKLENAYRIIPDWRDLDEEIKSFEERMRAEIEPAQAKPDTFEESPAAADFTNKDILT